MLRKFFKKLFALQPHRATHTLCEPSSRHIEVSTPELYTLFGRECTYSNTLSTIAPTPETVETAYYRA